MTHPIPFQRKFMRLRVPLDNLIPVRQWADENGYSYQGAISKIKSGRLAGWKHGSRWWVDNRALKSD